MKILGTEVSPWLISGAVVATGAAIVLATRQKKSGTAKKTEDTAITKTSRPSRGKGEPGEPCNTGEDGVFGNWDENGDCQVFWDDSYEDAVLGHAFNIYNESGSPDFCDDIYETIHEGTHQEMNILNPQIDEIVRESLARTYEYPASTWNPEHTGSFRKGTHAIQTSYKLARWAILRELCNFESVV